MCYCSFTLGCCCLNLTANRRPLTEHSKACQCTCDESGVVWRDEAVISLLIAVKARHSGTVGSDQVHKNTASLPSGGPLSLKFSISSIRDSGAYN